MIFFKAKKKQRGSLAGPCPGSWALTPDQWAGRQLCDSVWGPCPQLRLVSLEWAYSLRWGGSHPPSHTPAISHLCLHCPRRPSTPSAFTPALALSLQSERQEGEQSAREQDFFLFGFIWLETSDDSFGLASASALRHSHHPRVKVPGAP